jgi:hypothetical protein
MTYIHTSDIKSGAQVWSLDKTQLSERQATLVIPSKISMYCALAIGLTACLGTSENCSKNQIVLTLTTTRHDTSTLNVLSY